MKHWIASILLLLTFSSAYSQDFREQYEQFKKKDYSGVFIIPR